MKRLLLDYRLFWGFVGIQVVVLLAFIAPLLLGRYCGHGWGLVAAIGDIVGWLYLSQRYFRKKQLAASTRLIWLLLLACLGVIAVFEFTHLPH